ncbi:MAG: hypothetical protein KAS66_00980 [Candidatus Omnitrophica bacterium]|nr:hypothetical protein [Candidatus Omnitrophota bacterium]MCK5180234.1 hypothetical protein [Candidatus Omnitrophota bacterium]
MSALRQGSTSRRIAQSSTVLRGHSKPFEGLLLDLPEPIKSSREVRQVTPSAKKPINDTISRINYDSNQINKPKLRGKNKVNAEVSILSTCFIVARMITILGIPRLMLELNGG